MEVEWAFRIPIKMYSTAHLTWGLKREVSELSEYWIEVYYRPKQLEYLKGNLSELSEYRLWVDFEFLKFCTNLI